MGYSRGAAPLARATLSQPRAARRDHLAQNRGGGLRGATQHRHAAAVKAWNPADKPEWLTEETYRERIQPRFASINDAAISSALDISEPYAATIRAGRYLPHQRHWLTLAKSVGVSATQES